LQIGKNVGKETDIYSFGITLYELLTGHPPFHKGDISHQIFNIEPERIEHVSDSLNDIIQKCLQKKYKDRYNNFSEVISDLGGEVKVYEKVVLAKQEEVKQDYSTSAAEFHFGVINGKKLTVKNPADLADLLQKYPTQGKKHLYQGTIQKWVEGFDQSLYVNITEIIKNESPKDKEVGLVKAIYTLNPYKKFKTAGGIECGTDEKIGDALEKEASFYQKELSTNPNADFYLFLEARGSLEKAAEFREYIKDHEPKIALNMIVLELQGKENIKIEAHKYKKPEDLLSAKDDAKVLIVEQLIESDSKLSIWLREYPDLTDSVEKWRELGKYDETTFSYAVEEKSPFHFMNDLAFNLKDFKVLFDKQLQQEKHNSEIVTYASQFATKADFWLENYQDSTYLSIIEDFIRENISKINEKTCSKLIGYILNEDIDLEYYENKILSVVSLAKKNEILSNKTYNDHLDFILDNLKQYSQDDKLTALKTYLELFIMEKENEATEKLLTSVIFPFVVSNQVDMKDYWSEIKPIVDEGLRNGDISEETFKEQREIIRDFFEYNLKSPDAEDQNIYHSHLKEYLEESIENKDPEVVNDILVSIIFPLLKDKDWYWKEIKPVIDVAVGIKDETIMQQAEYLNSLKSELESKLLRKTKEFQDALEDYKSFDFSFLPKNHKQANIIIERVEKIMSSANAKVKEDTISAFYDIGESLSSLEKDFRHLGDIQSQVSVSIYEAEREKEQLEQEDRWKQEQVRENRAHNTKSFFLALAVIIVTAVLLAIIVGAPYLFLKQGYFDLRWFLWSDRIVIIGIGIAFLSGILFGIYDDDDDPGNASIATVILGVLVGMISVIWNGFNEGIWTGLGYIIISPFYGIIGGIIGIIAGLIGFYAGFVSRIVFEGWSDNYDESEHQGLTISFFFVILVAIIGIYWGYEDSKTNKSQIKINSKQGKSAAILDRFATVNTTSNVRKGPSNEYPVVGVVRKGERVKILPSQSLTPKWYHVRYSDGEGYVYYKLINVAK